ncbi:DNA-binding MarR family transcriptional regulator OS=Streptomyces albaduncus OX=68172 GN=FHS32_004549 PE=4 SV=1 [Streptomyces griseoloalbus]
MAAQPDAVAMARRLYEPYYARLAELFADYSPEELAVLNDWFRRATRLAEAFREESRRQT